MIRFVVVVVVAVQVAIETDAALLLRLLTRIVRKRVDDHLRRRIAGAGRYCCLLRLIARRLLLATNQHLLSFTSVKSLVQVNFGAINLVLKVAEFN